MKRTYNLTIIALFLAVITILALCGVSAEVAHADYVYDLTFIPNYEGFVSSETGVTFRVYVNSAGYDTISRITYDIVKLNTVGDVGNLTANKGAITQSGFELISDNVEVKKSDLTHTDNGTDKLAYYFDIKVNTICAIIPTVYYRTVPEEDEQASYGDIEYCSNVDSIAPTFRLTQSYWSSGRCRLVAKLNEVTVGTAHSGLDKVTLYSLLKGSSEYQKIDEQEISGYNYTYSVVVDYGNYDYYIEVSDNVGNTTGKQLLKSLASSSHNVEIETLVNDALAKMGEGGYSNKLTISLSNAYADYITVISDSNATSTDKDNAVKLLRTAYNEYVKANQDYENGIRNYELTVLNSEYLTDFTVEGAGNTLSFLDIGDYAELDVTLAKFDYEDVEQEKGPIIDYLDCKADEVYCITVAVTSDDDGKVKTKFSTPLTFSFKLEDYENIKAVQVAYDVNGKIEYHESNIVKYVDGTIKVTAPLTYGVVNIFVEKDSSNLYWLFSLTAIPLIIGGVLLIYAFHKINKIKKDSAYKAETAQNNSETEQNAQNINATEEKNPHKGKNTKNKKRR